MIRCYMKKISSFTIFVIASIIIEVFIIWLFGFIHNKPINQNCAETAFLKTVQAQKYSVKLTISMESLLRQYSATVNQAKKTQKITIDDSAEYIINYQTNEMQNNGHTFSTDNIADIRDIIFLIADNYSNKEQIDSNTWLYSVPQESFENYFSNHYTDLNNPFIGYNIIQISSISPIEVVFQNDFISSISFWINNIEICYQFLNYNDSKIEKERHQIPERNPIITSVYNRYTTNLLDTIPQRP